ncbi:aldo-keto reductase family 1 member E1 [Hypoxylon trugodes]|uniref:aldo-keto reductase family 1 member E1 n=1 Tax=Hypoxylon trugodes TaxID=326681 RepID=UPI00219F201C|nr:aldo-keto reductase family 1 member E1 [Hypoxylon trugodes]KAI1394242.1 aldo-keto reductase family 1 member E1 [Hypoxylon trugodes]
MSSANFSLASKVKLPSGKLMPQIQLGLYLMSRREASTAVRWALAAGYRGFDSAQMYRNEKEAGHAIRNFLANPEENTEGLTRQDIFFTSKLASSSTSYQAVRRSIRQSVDACGLGYIDLFLLHSPYGGREARLTSWRAVEDAIDDGEVKSGGISNYGVAHIEELMVSEPRIPPSVNQIEVHPFNTRTDIRAACAKYGIVVEAYAPLARAMRMKHPTIIKLSKKYSCTPAQLMVRWSLQHGLVPLPKSAKRERLLENVQVGGFQISNEDMEEMDDLDEYLVTDWDPTDAP